MAGVQEKEKNKRGQKTKRKMREMSERMNVVGGKRRRKNRETL